MKRTYLDSLLRAVSQGDKDRVIQSLRQSSCDEARAGRHDWATSLEGYASKLERSKYEPKLLQLLPNQGKAKPSLDAFEERVPARTLGDMVLNAGILAEVQEVILEHESREKLAAFQLVPKNRMLLVGPSGCGKTMLAEALAHATGKTFHILRMGQLMDSYLGNTIRNVENSFAAIAQCNGVFLFDEFDALATAREASQEVNEMRRALNSLLIHFEELTGESIVIAATNHPQSLDPAFRRRFHSILFFDSPTEEQRETLVRKLLVKHAFPADENTVKEIARLCLNMSFDETQSLTRGALVTAVLHGKTQALTDTIATRISNREMLRR